MNNWICEERFFFLFLRMIMFVHLQASEAQIMHDSWFDFALNKFHWPIFVSKIPQEEFSGSQGLQRHSRIRAWQIDGRQDPPRLGARFNCLTLWRLGEIGVLKIKIDIFIGQDIGPRSKRSLNTISYILRAPPKPFLKRWIINNNHIYSLQSIAAL